MRFIWMLMYCLVEIAAFRRKITRHAPLNTKLFTTIIPSGICVVYKPKEWTSNDVVTKIKSILSGGINGKGRNQKKNSIKVGHGGTLDPIAEGVLVLGIGEGTKLLAEYLAGSKCYTTKAKLGSSTDTYDCTGNVLESRPYDHVTKEIVLDTLPHFVGEIMQVPPMYSALRKNGKRLYELAREGIVIEREARKITIYDLQYMPSISSLPQYLGVHIECGGGCYVRSLIVDITAKMNTLGYMDELIRTKQGPFTIDDCVMQPDWKIENIVENIHKSSKKVNLDVSSIKPAFINHSYVHADKITDKT